MRDFLFVYLPFCLHSSCASDALGPFRPLSTLLRTGLDFESRCPRAPEGHAEPAGARPGVRVLAALSCHGDGSSRPDVAPGVAGFGARLLAVGLSPPRQHAGPRFPACLHGAQEACGFVPCSSLCFSFFSAPRPLSSPPSFFSRDLLIKKKKKLSELSVCGEARVSALGKLSPSGRTQALLLFSLSL